MIRALTLGALAGLAGLSACGPVSVEQAEAQCLRRARLAESPRGTVAVGVSSGGHVGGRVELDISGDYLMGRDPDQVFSNCVYRRSGQLPQTPLSAQPDWKG